jgi:phosphoribosylformimino-5-aminoimidazole carboxamide ribotide isomerase
VARRLTSTFDVLVAIDLRGGRVVRLEQGDYERETVFADDPVLVARGFVEQGARWLHVVDLDGARAGSPTQGDIIAAIAAIAAAAGDRTGVEASGGLRTAESVAETLALGVSRVAIGTSAIVDPVMLETVLATHGPARVAVAVDVRDGLALGHGWQPGSPGLPPAELIQRLAEMRVTTFEVTAVDRDGLLGGPDLLMLERLVGLGRGAIIASGGIRSAADVTAVRELGCAGAIIGRALYDGSLTLEAALTA